jgi:glucose-6-phosphate isomerase
LPLLEVELPQVSPYVLGAWMAWMMAAVYIASEILNVNAFDQPAVEDYKQATRMYLAHQY